MAVKLIKILYLVLVLNAATLAQTGSTPSQADSSSYEEWIRQFRQQSSPSKIRSSKDAKKEGEPFLMLSVVRDAPETVDPFRNGAGQIELGHQRVLPQNCAI